MPARHALGALLLERGRAEEAGKVFEADLTTYPNNMWSLQGLISARKATGSDQDLEKLQEQLDKAQQFADTKISKACFCANQACR